jgi:hypothetical protein
VPEANVPGRLRFRPPEVLVSKEVAWILLRAFGPRDAPALVAGSEGAAALARSLDLAARIAARTPRPRLGEEVGLHGARALTAAQGVAALNNERLLDIVREVAGCAAEVQVPIVLLKGMALHWTGRTPVDARAASDVDVLVAEPHLAAIDDALRRQGFRATDGGPPCEHQLPAFQREPGEAVDVHRFLPGVCLKGKRGFAGTPSLRERGLLVRLADLPGEAWAPSAPVLAAHVLVHGIAQHGFAPQSYPGTRMVADLLDLGVGDDDSVDVWNQATRFTSGHVDDDEAGAVWDLCVRLRKGEPLPEVLRPRERPSDALLAHILAGALDPAYRRALKLRVLGSGPSLLPRPLAWARDAAQALWPTRRQIEGLHGERVTALGALALRAARPFDLAWRAWQASRSAAAVRGRSPMP